MRRPLFSSVDTITCCRAPASCFLEGSAMTSYLVTLRSRSISSSTSPPSSQGVLGVGGPKPMNELRDLWPVIPELERKRHSGPQRPHVVFLEGGAGSGKHDVLWRLRKIGYTAVSTPPITSLLASGGDPKHHLIHLQWLRLLMDELDRSRTVKNNARMQSFHSAILILTSTTSHHARITSCL